MLSKTVKQPYYLYKLRSAIFFPKDDQMFQRTVVMDGVFFNEISRAAGIDAIDTMDAAASPRVKFSDVYCSSSSNQPSVHANGVDVFPCVPRCHYRKRRHYAPRNLHSSLTRHEDLSGK